VVPSLPVHPPRPIDSWLSLTKYSASFIFKNCVVPFSAAVFFLKPPGSTSFYPALLMSGFRFLSKVRHFPIRDSLPRLFFIAFIDVQVNSFRCFCRAPLRPVTFFPCSSPLFSKESPSMWPCPVVSGEFVKTALLRPASSLLISFSFFREQISGRTEAVLTDTALFIFSFAP